MARSAVVIMKWLRRLFRTRPAERNRVVNLRAVRQHKRVQLPGFAYDYGDFEENKRRAAALRKQAQRGDG
jgi:hypothetical protein